MSTLEETNRSFIFLPRESIWTVTFCSIIVNVLAFGFMVARQGTFKHHVWVAGKKERGDCRNNQGSVFRCTPSRLVFTSHWPKLWYMATCSWKSSRTGFVKCSLLKKKRTGKTQILPYLQAYKLVCHSFVDASRRYKIPGSEMKDFITYSTAGSMSFLCALIPLTPTHAKSHKGNAEADPDWCWEHRGFMSQMRSTEFKPPSFKRVTGQYFHQRKTTFIILPSASQEDISSTCQDTSPYNHPWNDSPEQTLAQNMKKCKRLMEKIVSQQRPYLAKVEGLMDESCIGQPKASPLREQS